MKLNGKSVANSFWFALEVIIIFMVVQLIRFIISGLDAVLIDLALIIVSLSLFLGAYFIARSKDRSLSKKQHTKNYSGISN